MSFTLNIQGAPETGLVGNLRVSVFVEDIFSQQLEEDLESVFFPSQGQDFTTKTTSVIYNHSDGKVSNPSVIFDNGHVAKGVGFESSLNTSRPKIQLRTKSLTIVPRKGDTVRVMGVLYIVDEPQSDGVGVSTLFLRER